MTRKARKASEFIRFLQEFEGTCQCGVSYRLKPTEVKVFSASRGEAAYLINCVCGRSGIGFFGSPEFLQQQYEAAERHFSGIGMQPIQVRLEVSTIKAAP